MDSDFSFSRSEWLEPDVDSVGELNQPKPELTTAYAACSMRLLAEMLKQIGKDDLAGKCENFSEGAVKAYSHYFVKDGKPITNRMANYVRPLALGLLNEDDEKSFAKELNEIAVRRNYTVGTGFLSTPFVLGVLTKYGYTDTDHVTIPSNCHARIELPDGTVREKKSGEYRYLISE